MNGTRATIVLDIKTASGPRSRNRFELAGQIRTEWQLRTLGAAPVGDRRHRKHIDEIQTPPETAGDTG
jgi:hypothetical protein